MSATPAGGLCDLVQRVRGVRHGAVEAMRECIERIEALDPQIHAFVDFRADWALQQARAADDHGDRRRPLHGIPVAVKEVFDVAGMQCNWGTPIHAGRVPSRDAPVVNTLRSLGAIVVGTTVSTEYAIAAAGPTVNPHDSRRTPGGSSSGSAAAVAAGMVPLALGSQSIGSVVRPATYCGVWGLKPTKGVLSTRGVMVLSEQLDHVGLFARSGADMEYAWRALCQDDIAQRMPSSLRVLGVSGPLRQRVQPASETALNRARALIRDAGLENAAFAAPDSFEQVEGHIFTILCRDMARHHGDDRRQFGAHMSARVRELIDRGSGISDDAYGEALAQAEAYREILLRELDIPGTVMLAAATDSTAPLMEEGTGSPLLQALWTLTGLPVLAVPCGEVGGLPVGVQLIAAPGQETLLFQVGSVLAAGQAGANTV